MTLSFWRIKSLYFFLAKCVCSLRKFLLFCHYVNESLTMRWKEKLIRNIRNVDVTMPLIMIFFQIISITFVKYRNNKAIQFIRFLFQSFFIQINLTAIISECYEDFYIPTCLIHLYRHPSLEKNLSLIVNNWLTILEN